MKLLIGISIIGSILITGCTQPKPVHNEVLNLDRVQSIETTEKIDKTIIVLKPTIEMLTTENSKRNDIRSQIIRMQEGLTGGDFNFNKAYSYKYGSTAGNALRSDISDILHNEGFKINDEYDTYDDIDFSVKKSAYLIIQPQIKASFITRNVKKEKSGSTLTETGIVSLAGSIKILSLEPLSKERLSSRKIDLSNLRLEKAYVSVRNIKSSNNYGSAYGIGKSLGSALGNAMWGSSEKDNTENTLISIVNDVQAYSIAKIKPRLQKENILSYENDILEIKSKKRY